MSARQGNLAITVVAAVGLLSARALRAEEVYDFTFQKASQTKEETSTIAPAEVIERPKSRIADSVIAEQPVASRPTRFLASLSYASVSDATGVTPGANFAFQWNPFPIFGIGADYTLKFVPPSDASNSSTSSPSSTSSSATSDVPVAVGVSLTPIRISAFDRPFFLVSVLAGAMTYQGMTFSDSSLCLSDCGHLYDTKVGPYAGLGIAINVHKHAAIIAQARWILLDNYMTPYQLTAGAGFRF